MTLAHVIGFSVGLTQMVVSVLTIQLNSHVYIDSDP